MNKLHMLSLFTSRWPHLGILACSNNLVTMKYYIDINLVFKKCIYKFNLCRHHSDVYGNINNEAISAYSKYLLQLHNSSKNINNKNIQKFIPSLLYDELGGKPKSAFCKFENLVMICKQLHEQELQCNELENLAEASTNEVDFLKDINSEITVLREEIKSLRDEFVDVLIQDKELHQCDGAILEIRAGVGGQEAMLFALELYAMYQQFCSKHGLEIKSIDEESEDTGGLLKASCIITSEDGFAYSILRHEAGIHRVQRVPVTESRGRIHTSTVSVAVIPKHNISSDSTFSIDPSEIKKTFTTSPKGGGQHVNKTHSCAVVYHIPTGLQIRSHATRVQYENLTLAMEQLKQLLYKRYLDKHRSNTNSVRMQQIKDRERSDKIRTYNYHENRITDHRIGYTVHGIESFLSAGSNFNSMMHTLNEKYFQAEKIAVFTALLKEANININ